MTKRSTVLCAGITIVMGLCASMAQAQATSGVVVVFDTTGNLQLTELTEQIGKIKSYLADEAFFAQDGSVTVGFVAYGRTGAVDLNLTDLDATSLENILFPALDAIAAQFPITGPPRKRKDALDAARGMLSARGWAPGNQNIIHVGQAWTHPQPNFMAELAIAATTEQPITKVAFVDDGSIATQQLQEQPCILIYDPVTGQSTAQCGGSSCTCIDDGLFCQVDDCVGLTCIQPDRDCSDSNVCTDDACDEEIDACTHTKNTIVCDDGDACTDSSQCSNGICLGSNPVNCDDNDLCTEDTCDPNIGCVNAPVICDDGDICTSDTCDSNTGACTFVGGCCAPASADDCNLNNILDSCDIIAGTSFDSDLDGQPDECEPGVDENGFIQHWALRGGFLGTDVLIDKLVGGCGYTQYNIEPNVGDYTKGASWIASTALLPIGDGRAVDFTVFNYVNSTAYAHTYIYNDTTRNVVALTGSDDDFELLIDGVLVSSSYAGERPSNPDDDASNVFVLTKGWHRVMVHVANGNSTSSWNFMLRFRDSDTTLFLNDLTATRFREEIPAGEGMAIPSDIAARPPAILDWLVLGPFDGGGCDSSCLDGDPVGCVGECVNAVDILDVATGGISQERDIFPYEGEVQAGTTASWTRLSGPRSHDFSRPTAIIDLNEHFGFDGVSTGQMNKVAYLHAYIDNPASWYYAFVELSSDSAGQVFVNGTPTVSSCSCAAGYCATGMTTSNIIVLRPGLNRLLIRMNGTSGDWGVTARIIDQITTDVLGGITMSLEPLADASIPVDPCVSVAVTDDCDGNGITDTCDMAGGKSLDLNGNGILDSCDFTNNLLLDCNGNGIADASELDAVVDPSCTASFATISVTNTADFKISVDMPFFDSIDESVQDQLSIDMQEVMPPFVWVTCPVRGTVMRVVTECENFAADGVTCAAGSAYQIGYVLGEYYTAPKSQFAQSNPKPHRLDVDSQGAAWILNAGVQRSEKTGALTESQVCANLLNNTCVGGISGVGCGSIVKVNARCVAQPGDVLFTSNGFPLDWIDNGSDIDGGTLFATDDCIEIYTLTSARSIGGSGVAVDANDNVWVASRTLADSINGGAQPEARVLQHLDGATGLRIPVFDDMMGNVEEIFCIKCGAFSVGDFSGGLIDSDGVLWFASENREIEGAIIRYDTNDPLAQPCCLRDRGACDHAPNSCSCYNCYDQCGSCQAQPGDDCVPFGFDTANYPHGVALGPNGHIWISEGLVKSIQNADKVYVHELNPASGNFYSKTHQSVDPNLILIDPLAHNFYYSNCLTVDQSGDVWVGSLTNTSVVHYTPSGNGLMRVVDADACGGVCPDVSGFDGAPVSMTTDRLGFIWVITRNSELARINPTNVPASIDFQQSLNRTNDECVGGEDNSELKFYWDPSSRAVWSVVREGPYTGTEWTSISWNHESCVTEHVPSGTTMMVEMRAAPNEMQLAASQFTEVTNGDQIPAGNFGRYIEVRVTFTGMTEPLNTPTLCDLELTYRCNADCNGNGIPDSCDLAPGETNQIPDACEIQPDIKFFPVVNGQIDDLFGVEIAMPVNECTSVGIEGSVTNGQVVRYEWDVTGDGLDVVGGPDAVAVQFIEDWASDGNVAPCVSAPTNMDCEKKTVTLRVVDAMGLSPQDFTRDIEIWDTELTSDDIKIQGPTSLQVGTPYTFKVLINEMCDSIATVEWDFEHIEGGAFTADASGSMTDYSEIEYTWSSLPALGSVVAVRVIEDDEDPMGTGRPIAVLDVNVTDVNPPFIARTMDLVVETRFHHHHPFALPATDITHSMEMRIVNRSATEEARAPIYVGFSPITPTSAMLATGDLSMGSGPLPGIGSYIEFIADGAVPLAPDEASPWYTVDWLVMEDDLGAFGFTAVAYTGQRPPTFELGIPPVPQAVEGEVFVYKVNATDADSDSLYFELGDVSSLSTPMTMNPLTGVITWTPDQTAADGSPYAIPLIVKDDFNEQSQTDLPIQVASVNVPPRFTTTPKTVAIVGEQYSYQPIATDDDLTIPDVEFVTMPGTFSPFFPIVWTPSIDDANSTFPVIVKAYDNEFVVYQEYEITVLACTTAEKPIITQVEVPNNPSDDPVAEEGLPFSLQITLSTTPSTKPVYYFLDRSPDGMTIDIDTGLIQWTPSYRSQGAEVVRVVASTDSDGYFDCADSEVFNLIVNDRHTAPNVILDPTPFATEGEHFTMSEAVTDEDGDSPHSFDLINAPSGMWVEPYYGFIQWDPSQIAAQNSPYDVTLRVSDPAGFWDEENFSLTVFAVDVPPTIKSLPQRYAVENQVYSYAIEAEELDDQVLTYELNPALSYPSGLMFDINDPPNVLSWKSLQADHTAAFFSPYPVSIIVSDGLLTDEQEFDLQVRATNEPPVLTIGVDLINCVTETYEGDTFRFNCISATDEDNVPLAGIVQDALTFSIVDPAIGMTINPTTGELVWKVPSEVSGVSLGTDQTLTFKVQVSDGTVTSPTSDLLITVKDRHISPVIVATPPLKVLKGELYHYQMLAHSEEVADSALVFTTIISPPLFVRSNGQSAMSNSGFIGWETAVVSPGIYDIKIQVSDGMVLVDYAFKIEVVDNSSPYIKTDPAPPEYAVVGTTYLFNLIGVNISSNLEWQLVTAPDGALLTPNVSQAEIKWGPGADQIGTHRFAVSVSNATSRNELGWSVTVSTESYPNQNHAPQFTSLPLIKGRVFSPYTYTVTAGDPDAVSGDVIAISLLQAPHGMWLEKSTDQLNNSVGNVLRWDNPRLGTHNIVIRVDDSRGGWATQEYPLTVSTDGINSAPVIYSVPPSTQLVDTLYSYQINAFDPDEDVLDFTVLSAPAGLLENLTTTGLLEWKPLATQVGPHTVVVRADDGLGGTVIQRIEITVYDNTINHSPTIVSVPPTSAVLGTPFEYRLTATDLEDSANSLTYTVLSGPVGLSHDSSDSVFPGKMIWPVLTIDDMGTHDIVVRVDDTKDGWDEQAFSITVSDISMNHPPVFVSTPPISAVADIAFIYDVSTFDPEGDELSVRVLEGPSGMTMDDPLSSKLTWTPGGCLNDEQTVVLMVDDGHGGTATQQFDLNVQSSTAPTNQSPIITSRPINRVMTSVGSADYIYQVAALDPDLDVLIFKLLYAPKGMTIDSMTGQIDWPAASFNDGSHKVELQVSDGVGGMAHQRFKLIASPDGSNYAPVATRVPPSMATVGVPYDFSMGIFDADDPLLGGMYSFERIPAGAVINPSWKISWTPIAAQLGSNEFAATYTDGNGVEVMLEWTVTVSSFGENHAPSITSIAPERADPAMVYTYNVAANDADGDAVVFSLIDGPNLMTIDNQTGQIMWASPVAGTYDITVRADDDNNASDEQRYRLAVSAICDCRPPQITSKPPTKVEKGQDYAYRIEAIANGNGTLSYGADAIMPAIVPNNTMYFGTGADSNVIYWDTTLTNNGTYKAKIRVYETPTCFTEQSFTITVSSSGDFEATRIISTPIVTAVACDPASASCPIRDYVYEVQATGSGVLHYDVAMINADDFSFGPVDFAFGTGADANKIIWPSASITAGIYDIYVFVVNYETVMNVTETSGATQSYRLTVSGNQPPRIISDAPPVAIIDGTKPCTDVSQDYVYEIKAIDPDDTSLTYEVLTAPIGMSMSGNVLTWQHCSFENSAGRYPVTIKVSDGEAATMQSFTVEAATWDDYDRYAPKVTVEVDPFVASLGQPVTITIHATDDTGIPSSEVDLQIIADGISGSNVPVPLDSNGRAFYPYTPPNTGGYQVRVSATDGSMPAKTGTGTADFFVPRQAGEPTFRLDICSPTLDEIITSKSLDITGIVNSDDFFKYTLEYRLIGEEDYVLFHTGYDSKDNGAGSCDGTAMSLGMLDTTQMLNGIYEIWVRIYDIGGDVQGGYTQVAITNKVKVGNLQLAFTDLDIPLAGLPVTVTRSYDSRDKRKGDFGIGWQLDVATMRLEENVGLGEDWGIYQAGWTGCYVQPNGPRYVTVTWPDNRVETFNLEYRSDVGGSADCQGIYNVNDVVLRNTDDFGSSIRMLGESDVPIFSSQTGQLTSGGDIDESLWEPLIYELTAPDRTHYIFEKRPGDRVAKVYQIIDRNDNTLTFLPNGVKHSASDDPNGWVVKYNRDRQGRIIEILDPMWFEDSTRGTIRYGYDTNGDLSTVTNQVDEVTTFLYNNEHKMTDIIGPDGRKVAHNVFDDQGMLIAHVDSEGNWIEYEHRLGTKTEVITDRLNHQKIYVYNEDGNVVTMTEDVTLDGASTTLTTTFDYDGRENQIKTILSDGTITSENLYNDEDNLIRSWDINRNKTVYTYTSDNLVKTVTDPLGYVTENDYDSDGNLILVTRRNPAGDDEVTKYTYLNGNRITEQDSLGNITLFEYYSSGMLKQQTDAMGNVSTFEYYSDGNLKRETRPAANGSIATTDYVYDGVGRLIQQTAASPDDIVEGVSTTTTYTLTGKTESVTTPDGLVTYEYDPRGNLVKTNFHDAGTPVIGSSQETGYDAEGRQLWSKDRDGVVTSTVYDELGRAVRSYLPDATPTVYYDGPFTETVYDILGRVAEHRVGVDATTPTVLVTSYTYVIGTDTTPVSQTVKNFVTENGMNVPHPTTTVFDANGNSVMVTDARDNVTQFEYDFAGRLVKTIYPDNLFTQVTYDRGGRKIAERDRAGLVTQFDYDKLGRLTSVTDAQIVNGQPGVTEFTYDEAGNMLSQADANGNTTSMTYDALGQMKTRTRPGSPFFESWSAYDGSNRLTVHTDFNFNETTLTFGNEGRLTTKMLPAVDTTAAFTVTYAYTPSGLRSSAGGEMYNYEEAPSISRGLLREETKANDQKLVYEYDGRGNRTKVKTYDTVTNASTMLSETDYAYDELNRLVLVTDEPFILGTSTPNPNKRETSYGYDAVGNRSLVKYPNGTCTEYKYDNLNRLTQLTNKNTNATTGACDGTDISSFVYTLGPAGNRTKVVETVVEPGGTNRQRTVIYKYDKLYRLIKESAQDNTDPISPMLTVRSFTYDRVGNRMSETVATSAGTKKIVYTYDENDKLMDKTQTVAIAANLQLEDLPHYAHAASKRNHSDGPKRTAPPSRWAGFGLGSFGVVTLCAFFAPLALLWPRRKRMGKRQHLRSLKIRCIGAMMISVMTIGPERVLAFHQQAIAYRAMSEALVAAAIAQIGNGDKWTYDYDRNGNMTSRVTQSSATTDTYHYDAENRLVSRNENNVQQVAYGYDVDGIRSSMTSSSLLTTYLTDKNRSYAQVLVETEDPTGTNTKVKYTYGDDLISQDRSGVVSYYHYDGQLSTRQLSSDTATITDTYTYEAFGELLPSTGNTTVNNYKYTGEQYDPNVGFYYLRARYYDQSNGRFATNDSVPGNNLDPASLHRYAYVESNPANRVDPSGLTSQLIRGKLAHWYIQSVYWRERHSTAPWTQFWGKIAEAPIRPRINLDGVLVEGPVVGFADILDRSRRELYEIKTGNFVQFGLGLLQLAAYSSVSRMPPGRTWPEGIRHEPFYDGFIDYWLAAPGIILYKVTQVKPSTYQWSLTRGRRLSPIWQSPYFQKNAVLAIGTGLSVVAGRLILPSLVAQFGSRLALSVAFRGIF